ncbi:heme exporter protein CcmD [Aliiroseovarius sp. PTFE2010]|uniref:heme exporter protein CcmD n=1 Tax=Aliiroseovarius sp. PTFE2010 TaxID=3417190 RepID=UPI003CED93C5
MMPDLGKYAGAVLSAYGATIVLLLGVLVLSVLRARAVKRRLDAAEERRNG